MKKGQNVIVEHEIKGMVKKFLGRIEAARDNDMFVVNIPGKECRSIDGRVVGHAVFHRKQLTEA